MAADDTRAHVLGTALRLFRERGYEATTMRLIATEAGVATGNAYYHFPSKGHLVQELYREVNEAHAQAVAPVLAGGGGLADRLSAVLHSALDTFAEYHAFGGEFVAVALRPAAAASPFSTASAPAREVSLAVFTELVAGCRPAVPASLRADLPELLWLLQLGLTLVWVHDTTPGQRRSHQVVDAAVPLVASLVRLSRLPVLRGPAEDLVRLVRLVRA